MITQSELKLVDELRRKQNLLKSALNSFDSPYVKTVAGLVDVNSASPQKPQISEHAEFLHRDLPELCDELTARAKSKLSHKLKEVELELSQYIGEPA